MERSKKHCSFSVNWNFILRSSHLSVCLSVCQSICSSVCHEIFSRLDHQFFLILYMMIADHDNLVSNKARLLKKKWWSEFGPKGPKNQAQNDVFQHFLEFGSLVFLEIEYNDSLQQCLICSRGKTHRKKFLGPKLEQTSQNWPEMRGFFAIFPILVHYFSLKLHTMITCNNVELKPTKNLGTKIGSKVMFFTIFSSFVHQFSFKSDRMMSYNNVQLLVEVKCTKKVALGSKCGPIRPKFDPKLDFLPFSQVWSINFP